MAVAVDAGGEWGAVKLDALKRLAKLVGRSREQVDEFLRQQGGDLLMAFGACLVSNDSSDISKAAAATALDLLCPGWRAAVPALRGHVLRRSSPEVGRWRAAVLKRDGMACRCCGSGVDLHVHHIVRWADEPILRVSVDNGLSLCQPCHTVAHHG